MNYLGYFGGRSRNYLAFNSGSNFLPIPTYIYIFQFTCYVRIRIYLLLKYIALSFILFFVCICTYVYLANGFSGLNNRVLINAFYCTESMVPYNV